MITKINIQTKDIYALDPNKDGTFTRKELETVYAKHKAKLDNPNKQLSHLKIIDSMMGKGNSIKYFKGCDINGDGKADNGICDNLHGLPDFRAWYIMEFDSPYNKVSNGVLSIEESLPTKIFKNKGQYISTIGTSSTGA